MRVLNQRGGTRLVAVGSAVLLAASGLTLTFLSSGPASASVAQVAPYVDMSNSQEGVLDTVISSDGLRSYTAAFVIGAGCTQEWGDTLPIGNDSFTDPEIARAKSEGAQLIVSSGGADGEPIAWTCTNQSTIDSAYQQILTAYSPSGLDFDIEGAAQADTAAATRNFQAMKDLGVSNYSITLPVLPSGLTNYGIGILQAAQNLGMKIPIVNIMAMDYYEGTGTEMGQAAIQAAQSTLAQMQAINSSYTYANVGITPMIGVNDDGSTFTLSDASTVASWASSNGIGRLAFWSVDRDQSCPGGNGGGASSTCSGVSQSTGQFTSAFTGAGGGSAPPPPPPSSPPPSSASPSPSPSPSSSGTSTGTWAPGVAYTVGEIVTYDGHTYKCLQSHTSEVGWDPADVPALWQLVS